MSRRPKPETLTQATSHWQGRPWEHGCSPTRQANSSLGQSAGRPGAPVQPSPYWPVGLSGVSATHVVRQLLAQFQHDGLELRVRGVQGKWVHGPVSLRVGEGSTWCVQPERHAHSGFASAVPISTHHTARQPPLGCLHNTAWCRWLRPPGRLGDAAPHPAPAPAPASAPSSPLKPPPAPSSPPSALGLV